METAKSMAAECAPQKGKSDFQFPAGQKPVSFEIFRNRFVNDFLRKVVIAVRICLEPVTDELLVEGRL